jgi:hypothetical protein
MAALQASDGIAALENDLCRAVAARVLDWLVEGEGRVVSGGVGGWGCIGV